MNAVPSGYRFAAWALAAAALYAGRAVLAPVFLILLVAFFAGHAVEWLSRRAHVGRVVGILAVFFVLTFGYALLVWWITPNLLRELDKLSFKLPSIAEAVKTTRNNLAARNPELEPLIRARLGDEAIDGWLERVQSEAATRIPRIANQYATAAAGLAVCLALSFMMVLYRPRLSRGYARLEASRGGPVLREVMGPIFRLSGVVGRAMEAQAMIAVVNTLLTTVGLILLGMPLLAILGVIVFFCSFIPVIGTLLSTAPMVMIALTDGGPVKAGLVMVMIGVIHALEAYVLNPIIYGRHLKLNPVLVIMVLYIGHHSFGLWGMVLGVPVAHYLLHDVFGLPQAGQRGSGNESDPPPTSPTAPAPSS